MKEQGTARTQALAARTRLLDGLWVTERAVEVGGIETSLFEGGAGGPLVLLHGQGASAVAWAPIIPALQANHRVVVPDLPGLGESLQVRDGELDATRVADWLNGLIAETCDEPPTIVGLSLGGTIAAHFAVDHGDRCRSVVLVDSSSLGPFRPSLGGLTALLRASARPTQSNLERLFRHVVVDRFKALLGPRWVDFTTYMRERMDAASVKAANQELLRRLGSRRIPVADLRRIACPVTLIWGGEDEIMKLGIAESVASELGWPLQVLEDCGHAAYWDRPEAFVEALERWLVRVTISERKESRWGDSS